MSLPNPPMKKPPPSSRCVVTLLLLVIGGCTGLKVHTLADGRAVPDSWATAPVPSTDQPTNLLHFDSLYVMQPVAAFGVTGRPSDWEMSYYRFWPGGQVLLKP